VTDKNLSGAPLLAVEVLSPSTGLFDLGRRMQLLEEAGCPSYWVVDPAGPELTAWELRAGATSRSRGSVRGLVVDGACLRRHAFTCGPA